MLFTAVVAFIVASLSGMVSAVITISVARRTLQIDLKRAYAVELFKKRLAVYPPVWEALGALSEQAVAPLDEAKAILIARQLNDWLYSVGGLCADRQTRRALLDVRNGCLDFASAGFSISTLRELRDNAMIYLRKDLALKGLESFDTNLSRKGEEVIIHE